MRDLNAALRTVLEGVWLNTVTDPELGEVLIARFLLRGTHAAPPRITLATELNDSRRLRGQPILPVDNEGRSTTAVSVVIPPMRVPLGGKADA